MATVTEEQVFQWRTRYEALSWFLGDDDTFIVKCIAANDLHCRPCDVSATFDYKRRCYECEVS